MSEQPPSHPLYDNAPGRSHGVTRDPADWYGMPRDDREREVLQALKPKLEKLIAERQVVFEPELLIRTYLGDKAARPYGGAFWESPDIWIVAGDPSSTPAVPAIPGGTATAGQPNTLYAHVWNLGLAPVAAVTVEFLVFDPAIWFESQQPLFRAVTRIDLAGRSSPYECHKLVKCPVPWVPVMVNGGHECVIARASSVADPLQPAHQFEPAYDRHVGQRNITVAAYGADLSALLAQLRETLPKGAEARYRLIGPEAQRTVDLVAPGRRIDPRTRTVEILDPRRIPEPAPGQVAVVRLEGVRDRSRVVGGYTLVLTDATRT